MDPYTQFDIDKTIKDLLKKLVKDQPKITWKIRGTYANGKEPGVIELSIYKKPEMIKKGTIAYNPETGEVKNFFYKDVEGLKPDSIVDLLLDIINLENQK